MWRKFEFLTYEKFLSVEQLVIHLPEKQPIYFEKNVIVEKL